MWYTIINIIHTYSEEKNTENKIFEVQYHQNKTKKYSKIKMSLQRLDCKQYRNSSYHSEGVTWCERIRQGKTQRMFIT